MNALHRHLAASFLAAYGITAPIAARAQQVVGAVSAANASPTGRTPGGVARTLRLGADIFFKDHIATKRGGAAQLTFLDRSTLNVSENSDVVIDEFVYNPGAGGKMSATLTRGTLRFVGGDISHDGGTTIKTPAVTIGIRGGIGLVAFVKDTAVLAAFPGLPAAFHGGTIVVNGFGILSVRNGANEVVISRPGFAVFVGSANEAIDSPRRFDMSAAQVLMKSLGSKAGQRGGASSKTVATLATREANQIVHIPVVIPRPPTIDALSFTGVFTSGNVLARNQAHVHQAAQLQQQLASATTPAAPTSASARTSKPTSSGATSGGTTSGGSTSGGSTSGGSTSGGSTSGGSTSGGSTSGGSTSGGSTSGGVESVHDLNASTVTANVIYAHTIDAATIQGVVVKGNGYGNGSGSDVNESTFTTAGQLNAHDIHATTVIANFIYVDGIND